VTIIILMLAIMIAASICCRLVYSYAFNKSMLESVHAPEIFLNYFMIAQLEQDMFGQTWHNQYPALGRYCECMTCNWSYLQWTNLYYGQKVPMVAKVKSHTSKVQEDWRDRNGE
jgi:hypothetical protein